MHQLPLELRLKYSFHSNSFALNKHFEYKKLDQNHNL